MSNLLKPLIFCAVMLAPTAFAAESAPDLVAEAESLAMEGDYDAALPLYEQAIAALSDEPREQNNLRYRYGIVLSALGGELRPDLYPLARAQFESVLDFLDSGETLTHSPARVRSALAHTYHQQAATAEGGKQADLLRNAYFLYRGALSDLASRKEWHNLAITYFNLGQVCEWQGNLVEAVDWLEKAVDLDAEHGFADLEEDRAYLLALREQLNPPARATTTAL
ncbi:Tetratricopeptide repeat protein [Microbulbifer aggregans]|uniref:Tetratricopeptide repeat protein n=1 Tax=Microbulbifer aggregans TaxID=1769779 RepID=A0A1C9W780_9GAMM|nr:tetratricopeptide repeat protein [Microbulbifer aggregans]AOS97015.1 Tetratricopeptide repeat protein [Microbulbifer aggregans]